MLTYLTSGSASSLAALLKTREVAIILLFVSVCAVAVVIRPAYSKLCFVAKASSSTISQGTPLIQVTGYVVFSGCGTTSSSVSIVLSQVSSMSSCLYTNSLAPGSVVATYSVSVSNLKPNYAVPIATSSLSPGLYCVTPSWLPFFEHIFLTVTAAPASSPAEYPRTTIGGEILPINRLLIVLPWLTLLVVLGIVAASTLTASRKPTKRK